jgi:hypothetical protein
MRVLTLFAVMVLGGCMTSQYQNAALCEGSEFRFIGIPLWRQEQCAEVNLSDSESPRPVTVQPMPSDQ